MKNIRTLTIIALFILLYMFSADTENFTCHVGRAKATIIASYERRPSTSLDDEFPPLTENHKESEKPEVPVEKSVDIISKYVFCLIQSASEKALLLRRDILEISHIKKRHGISVQLKDTELTERYVKQLKEKKQNIRIGLSDYESIIKLLAEVDPKTVSVEFDNYTDKMAEAGRLDKVNIIELVKRHYQDYLKNKKLNVISVQKDLEKFNF